MQGKNKIVLVTNIPSPYRIPLFNEISEQLQSMGYSLFVIFGNKSYSRRKFDSIPEQDFKFEFHFLNSETVNFGNEEKTYFSYKGLFKKLKEVDPACVIMNGFTVASTRLWLTSLFTRQRYILWVGSVNRPGRFDSLIRRIQRKLIIRNAAAFVAYGSLSEEYLKSMKADPKKIFIGINTVDTNFFKDETERQRASSIKKDNLHHLTYVGYLSARKNVNKVLEVIEELNNRRDDFILDLIGDGPEKKVLEKYSEDKGISDRVIFHGFKQKEDLPEYLAQSDCFLFQTDFDIWGLVLNETMAAGVPVIASPNAGSTKDLIIDGVNGYISDFEDPKAVCDLIETILDNEDFASQLRKKASEHIHRTASIELSARGFTNAVRFALH